VANKPSIEKIKGIINWQGITMAGNQEQEWKDMKLESLEAELRCLPGVRIPETLKAKLFARIPDSEAGASGESRVQWWARVWRFGAAVAAVVILALIFVPNYGPSGPSNVTIADLNDRPTRCVLADQNSTLVEDTNYVNRCGKQ